MLLAEETAMNLEGVVCCMVHWAGLKGGTKNEILSEWNHSAELLLLEKRNSSYQGLMLMVCQ